MGTPCPSFQKLFPQSRLTEVGRHKLSLSVCVGPLGQPWYPGQVTGPSDLPSFPSLLEGWLSFLSVAFQIKQHQLVAWARLVPLWAVNTIHLQLGAVLIGWCHPGTLL